jgi:hypothetical protein
MSLNTPPYSRASVTDFVNAVSYPASAEAYLDYVRVNQIKDNIDYEWTVFNYCHRADGGHNSFTPASNAVYVDAFHFGIPGNWINTFSKGRMVKLDCGTDGVFYERIEDIYVSDGNTIFQIRGGSLTSNLNCAYFGFPADWQALPEDLWLGSYRVNSPTNILDASRDYTSAVLSTSATVTRILAQGHFCLNGRPSPELSLQKASGAEWVDVKSFNLNQYTEGFTLESSTNFRLTISSSDGTESKSLVLFLG